jgi:hypothetical protein
MKSPVTGIAELFVLFVVLIVGYSSVFTGGADRTGAGGAAR